jgi:hypothetical protein
MDTGTTVDKLIGFIEQARLGRHRPAGLPRDLGARLPVPDQQGANAAYAGATLEVPGPQMSWTTSMLASGSCRDARRPAIGALAGAACALRH